MVKPMDGFRCFFFPIIDLPYLIYFHTLHKYVFIYIYINESWKTKPNRRGVILLSKVVKPKKKLQCSDEIKAEGDPALNDGVVSSRLLDTNNQKGRFMFVNIEKTSLVGAV